MNKKKMLAVGLASLGIAGVLGSGAALAETGSGSTLAEKIATHFNLNKDEVQKVLDQDRADHQADREKQYEERLQKAVDDKKITSEQRDKILAKHKELESYFESQRDAMKDKTPQERRDAMKTKMDEITQWEKDNNIPAGYLHPGGPGMGHGPGRGKGMMHGGPDGNDPAPDVSPSSQVQ